MKTLSATKYITSNLNNTKTTNEFIIWWKFDCLIHGWIIATVWRNFWSRYRLRHNGKHLEFLYTQVIYFRNNEDENHCWLLHQIDVNSSSQFFEPNCSFNPSTVCERILETSHNVATELMRIKGVIRLSNSNQKVNAKLLICNSIVVIYFFGETLVMQEDSSRVMLICQIARWWRWDTMRWRIGAKMESESPLFP